jgi:amino acid transporter
LFKQGIAPISGIIAIVAIAPWAYVGFDNIPQAAEEFNFPPKKAFSLIISSLVFAMLLYSCMVAATAVGMPWEQLAAGQPIWGTGDIVSQTLGIIGVILLVISVLMGVFTGLNGFYVSASRLMFSMGRANILPVAFSKLHPKHGTPYVGIFFTCCFCLIAPWFGRQVLLWIVDMSSIGVTIAYLYTCCTAYKQFKWGGSQGQVSPVKKWLCLMGAVFSLGFLALLLIPASPASLGAPSFIALIVWSIFGIVFYLLKRNDYKQLSKETMDYYILGTEVKKEEPPHYHELKQYAE